MQSESIVHDRYRLKECLGKVWIAEDLQDHSLCLLRRKADFSDPQVLDWLQDAWIPGIPRVLERLTCDHEPWLVMEYLPGKTFHDQMQHRQPGFSETIYDWMLQSAKLLSILHDHAKPAMVHLDIKPEHWIVSEQGQVSLIDFSAARCVDPAGHPEGDPEDDQPRSVMQKNDSIEQPGIISEKGIQAQHMALTPEYAAPEQLAGQPCPASDCYAWGLVMVQLLTGQTPSFCRNHGLHSFAESFPQGIKIILERCLAIDPAQRYLSAGLLLADLQGQSAISLSESAERLSPVKRLGNRLGLFRKIRPIGIKPEPADGFICCVWDGAEFGCELAAVWAESSSVLLIEADCFNPQADLLLGLPLKKNWLPENCQAAGLEQALLEQQQGRLSRARLRQISESSRVHQLQVLLPYQGLAYYEACPHDGFQSLLQLARTAYDCIILLCNRFIYDAFTCLGLLNADCVAIPLAGHLAAFRTFRKSIEFLQSQQIINPEKIHYIAFSYHHQDDLSWSSMDTLAGGRLSGYISEQKNRRQQRSGRRPYATAISQQNRLEYQNLIRQLLQQQKISSVTPSLPEKSALTD